MSDSVFVDGNLPVQYSSAEELATLLELAVPEIESLQRQLRELLQRLSDGFNTTSFHGNIQVCGVGDPIQIRRELKRAAWRVIFDKLGIQPYYSLKRLKKMHEALSEDVDKRGPDSEGIDKMPDITAESMRQIVSGIRVDRDMYITEKVCEVYQKMKPTFRDQYKTNIRNRWKLSDKVLFSNMVSEHSGSRFSISCTTNTSMLHGLDIAMHYFDGKPVPTGYRSPLMEELHMSNGKGETEYFSFKCFKNRALHLKLLRPYLVALFNQRCGHPRALPGRTEDPYQAGDLEYDFTHIAPGTDYELFETPQELAEEMCDIADVSRHDRVLEPSCGKLRIAFAAAKRCAQVHGYELQQQLTTTSKVYEMCYKAGYGELYTSICVEKADFLKTVPSEYMEYDSVLMNPPFSRGRAAAHIRHAWSFLKTGGVLVAIADAGITFRQRSADTEFRAWLDSINSEVRELPAGTFKESGTSVNAVLLILRKYT